MKTGDVLVRVCRLVQNLRMLSASVGVVHYTNYGLRRGGPELV